MYWSILCVLRMIPKRVAAVACLVTGARNGVGPFPRLSENGYVISSTNATPRIGHLISVYDGCMLMRMACWLLETRESRKWKTCPSALSFPTTAR